MHVALPKKLCFVVEGYKMMTQIQKKEFKIQTFIEKAKIF